MMRSRLRIGTRGSALSLRQTEPVVHALREAAPGLTLEIVVIQTAGDRAPDVPLERLEGTGFFARELEAALLDERCDLAVHSAKDLPTEIHHALCLAAFPPRADPRDVLITASGARLAGLPPAARIGTSSVRRSSQLLHHRSDLQCLPIRGNVDTRLRKLEAGAYEAVCLAAAGLLRMGWDARIAEWFSPAVLLPAPGQGAIAVEARRADDDVLDLLQACNHRPTQRAVEAERAFVARLGSGCRAPAAALACVHDDTIALDALVASPDGRVLERSRSEGPADAPARVGQSAAETLLARAGALIDAIRDGGSLAGLRPAGG
jgi:hydroxymethylbilane synthase